MFNRLAAGSALALIICAGCNSTADRNKSKEARFVDAFSAAYEAGDKDDLFELTYQHAEIPDELSKLQRMLFTLGVGVHKIDSIQLSPYEKDPIEEPMMYLEKPIATNLDPLYWLEAKTSGNEGFEGSESNVTIKAAVGEHEGRLYFCGLKWDTENE